MHLPHRLLLCLAVATTLVAADRTPSTPGDTPAESHKAAPLTFAGVIHTKSGVLLKLFKVGQDKTDKTTQPFELSARTKITLDGKPAAAQDLKADMAVTVTYDASGVISVDAKSVDPKKKK